MLSKTKNKNLRKQRSAERYLEKRKEFENWEWFKIQKSFWNKEIYVQFELFKKILDLWLKVSLEVSHKIEHKLIAKFDLVIFDDVIWDTIIEVKRSWAKITKSQIIKYSKFNADLLFCIGKEQIEDTIKKIQQKYKK